MFSSNNNKRRSIFFGGGNGNNKNNTSNKEAAASKPSTFKTFSVVHVNDSGSSMQQSRPDTMVRRSSSQYKSKQIVENNINTQSTQQYATLKPSGSILSKRPPPPTLDINSIYDTIQRHESQSTYKAPYDINDEFNGDAQYNQNSNIQGYSDNTSSMYVDTPTTLKYPAKKLTSSFKENFNNIITEPPANTSYESGESQDIGYESPANTNDPGYNNFITNNPIMEEVSVDNTISSETDSEDDMPSYTHSANFVENGDATQFSDDTSEHMHQNEDTPVYDNSNFVKQEFDDSINDDFVVSSNYKIQQPSAQKTGILNEFSKRHNREKSELEEYLEELEDFKISETESADFTTQSYINHDTTNTTMQMDPAKRNSLASEVSSIVFETAGGLKVVNAESDSDDRYTDITPENESISLDENDDDSASDNSSFLEKHSQLSAVKSLYHSEDDGAWLEQGSVPSLPYTIENNGNDSENRHFNDDQSLNKSFDIVHKNSIPTMSTEESNYMDSLSEEPFLMDQKSTRTGESSIHFVAPESKYINRLLHKHPTAKKKTFKFDLPLNLLKNPAEDLKAKTAVLKNPRKSKNIKHKTVKKKLLSNEEPTPIELLKTKSSGFGIHSKVKDGNHRLMGSGLGDIDEEERLILQQLPGSEGYQENSLASTNNSHNLEKSKLSAQRQMRNRSDTVKSYYTRNVSRLRTETISTIDTMNNVNLEGLQITNPDSD